MAEKIATRRIGGQRSRAFAALLALATIQIGCASSGGGPGAGGPVPPPPGAPRPSTEVSQPAQIRALELREEGEVAFLDVVADRALVWTNYRDSHGNLVVELPNSSPAPSVDDLTTDTGLVASVEIEWLDDAERPLTRLVVRTREDSEHSLTTEGEILRLQLLPAGYDDSAVLAYEPVAEPSGAAPAAAAGQAASYGTPEAPVRGPQPRGVAASRLYSVDVETAGGTTTVHIVGDGEFYYSTFLLPNPIRLVIDLDGVIKTTSSATVQVASDLVDRIRIAQFKPRPDPVSRVVFDLYAETQPRIEPSADGLLVSFSAAAPATAVAETGEPEALPGEPEAMPAVEPVEGTGVAGIGEPTAGEPAAGEPAAGEPAAGEEPELMAAEPAVEVAAIEDPAPEVVPPPMEPPPMEPPPAAVAEVPAPIFEPAAEPQAAPPPYQPSEGTTYQPPAPPPSVTRAVQPGDVSLFEAQEVDVTGAFEDEQSLFPAFSEIVINRHRRQYHGDPINMSLKNADLVETLRSFASISGLNFVIQPGVSGAVTVELKQVPWDQAMEQILRIHSLGMDIDGTIVRIAPAEQLRQEAEAERAIALARAQTVQLRTVMKRLSYANAAEVSTLLRNRSGAILSDRGTVQIDQRTNTLIIREVPSNINTVLAVIENLDSPEAQVTIEARVIEATKTFARSLGIQWDWNYLADSNHGNTTGLQFPNNGSADGGVGLLTGGANGFLNLSMGNILNTFNLNARLQMAENEGLVNVISSPRVTTLNNTPASIQSGLQIPIQTVSNQTVSVQFVNATLQLAVTPHVTAEGTIILNINVAKRSPQLAFAITGAANAPIATKEASTTVIVRDGGTAVIGGIYQVSSNQNEDRVPGLANIPVLGHLFKNRSRNEDNDELMIFVTPHIIQM